MDYAKTMPKYSICAATVGASSGKRTAIHASSIINRQITNQMSPAATQKLFMCPSRLRLFSNFSLFKPRQFFDLYGLKKTRLLRNFHETARATEGEFSSASCHFSTLAFFSLLGIWRNYILFWELFKLLKEEKTKDIIFMSSGIIVTI